MAIARSVGAGINPISAKLFYKHTQVALVPYGVGLKDVGGILQGSVCSGVLVGKSNGNGLSSHEGFT